MGEIVAAGIVAHVPTVMFDEKLRRELNDGEEITVASGLQRLKDEKLSALKADTVIVLDAHWFSTFEHIIAGHERRSGSFTSSELPRGLHGVAYDHPGDPELAHLVGEVASERDDTWVHVSNDPQLPIYYPTINLAHWMQANERWVSAAICQTGTDEDFLRFGEVIGEAIQRSDRRVVLMASGALSHKFLNLQELRQRESSAESNIHSPEAVAADHKVMHWFSSGDHAAVIDNMEWFKQFSPEARFAPYLIMAGALGGRDCVATGELFSKYEASIGTGQVHIWFDRPTQGWTGS